MDRQRLQNERQCINHGAGGLLYFLDCLGKPQKAIDSALSGMHI